MVVATCGIQKNDTFSMWSNENIIQSFGYSKIGKQKNKNIIQNFGYNKLGEEEMPYV